MNSKDTLQAADETITGSGKIRLLDRKRFVENLGWLLSQTREGIVKAYLSDDQMVHVVYRGGYVQDVNVNMDSYMAIIRDVTKYL